MPHGQGIVKSAGNLRTGKGRIGQTAQCSSDSLQYHRRGGLRDTSADSRRAEVGITRQAIGLNAALRVGAGRFEIGSSDVAGTVDVELPAASFGLRTCDQFASLGQAAGII